MPAIRRDRVDELRHDWYDPNDGFSGTFVAGIGRSVDAPVLVPDESGNGCRCDHRISHQLVAGGQTSQTWMHDTAWQRRPRIADRIFLAGEALDKDPGYVDTAWRDGRRAANLIIGA